MQLGFILHDFNSDSKIDINDAYDLMYVGNLIKTPVFQLIQNDLFGINQALKAPRIEDSD